MSNIFSFSFFLHFISVIFSFSFKLETFAFRPFTIVHPSLPCLERDQSSDIVTVSVTRDTLTPWHLTKPSKSRKINLILTHSELRKSLVKLTVNKKCHEHRHQMRHSGHSVYPCCCCCCCCCCHVPMLCAVLAAGDC